MKFVDSAQIYMRAGDGGNGIASFRREAHVPLGGPFGGDGGKGASIIFEADPSKFTLLDLRYQKKIIAQNGENGKTKKMHGADGEDIIVKVPVGTVVKDHKTGLVIADLTNNFQKAVICAGGRGGRGNFHFKTSRNPAPDYCENGEPGQELNAYVELKVMADVGLVGFPSVGKSTILSVVSNAKPEIADYPFTTLTPKVGIVAVGDGRSFVMADLPGLIEGASLGKGLGHEFLKHIERCRVIVHVVDMSAPSGRNPIDDYKIINNELEQYKYKLLERPQVVLANKMDEENAEENLKAFKKAYPSVEVFPTTSLIGEGLQPVLYKVADLLAVTPTFPLEDEKEDVGVVYKYKPADEKFIIRNLGSGKWSVESDEVTRMLNRYDLQDEEDAIKFGISLRRMGIEKALIEKGATSEDTVYINDYAFSLTELL